MKNNLTIKNISQIDKENIFFHYTNKNNLNNILKNGLEPRIGNNSMYVEKTKKVFFVQGEKGILTIMDVWLRWLTAKNGVNKFIYCLGTLYMKTPFCIKCVPDYVVNKALKNKSKRLKALQQLKDILDNSIFLTLDLEEDIDFSYNDIDEVKDTYYESFLKLLYPSTSDIKDKKIEYWNMHTYSNKVIEPTKISLLKDNNYYSANIILQKIIENNIEYVKENRSFLYEYYNYVKKEEYK